MTGKHTEKNEKVCDALDVKEGLLSDEGLVTVLRELKNNKAPGDDSVVNELFFNMVVVGLDISCWRLWIWFWKKGKYLAILRTPP